MKLSHPNGIINANVQITGSKSVSNRLLILNQLFDNVLNLKNLSNSEDTQLLQKALENDSTEIDIHHAGTAMRFLTAFYSSSINLEKILTGSERMQQRPIKILVDALKSLGATIDYLNNDGFPPIKIKGVELEGNIIELPANISSQYITALMLIAPKQPNGLMIRLKGKITSIPYIQMTVDLMQSIGLSVDFDGRQIVIHPQKEIQAKDLMIESDWSSVSYFYSITAIAKKASIKVGSYFKDSLQGDSALQNIYEKHFGVRTVFHENLIVLTKSDFRKKEFLELDLNNTPDIAQTIALTCVFLKQKCKLTGLETLKIKETDRLVALQNELTKLGAEVYITNDRLEIVNFNEIKNIPTIKTYNDHRMAMAFAPAALHLPIEIEHPDVVEKSYPEFWSDMKMLGFKLEKY